METSCGIVLVNCDSVLLLLHRLGHWDLPKGHIEDGEEHIETALRELKEETGIENVIIDHEFKSHSEYAYKNSGRLKKKQVHWFLATTTEIDVVLSREHDAHVWLDWESAEARLTHEESKLVLRDARAAMK